MKVFKRYRHGVKRGGQRYNIKRVRKSSPTIEQLKEKMNRQRALADKVDNKIKIIDDKIDSFQLKKRGIERKYQGLRGGSIAGTAGTISIMERLGASVVKSKKRSNDGMRYAVFFDDKGNEIKYVPE